ncbi:uncharacterized protein RCC_06712 [Ramularia collo-cygni]|uniref:Uncharacterized protein n=1 Tax=Ramularia collo-cygni TaxID=112498 RepID=A0A2D3UTK8_9PEZI|nr:uncharacterized protein RCC_06712 [Ramularia collo-cygni]CZT20852.1 uncharacterized protein RCC_06712 [Ramularia collo-cygni]
MDQLPVALKAPAATKTQLEPNGEQDIQDIAVYPSLILPIQTSAAVDASLILLAADLACNPEAYTSSTMAYVMPFVGFASYLFARLGDFRLAQGLGRWGILKPLAFTANELPLTVSCLACLFAVRAGLAWIVENLTEYPILCLVLLQPTTATVILDNSRLETFDRYSQKYTGSLVPTLAKAQGLMYILGYFYLRRVERNTVR